MSETDFNIVRGQLVAPNALGREGYEVASLALARIEMRLREAEQHRDEAIKHADDHWRAYTQALANGPEPKSDLPEMGEPETLGWRRRKPGRLM